MFAFAPPPFLPAESFQSLREQCNTYSMPKVEKPRSRAAGNASDVLAETVTAPMETSESPMDPLKSVKPKFAPLTAHEQNGKKLEFRRVSFRPQNCKIVDRHRETRTLTVPRLCAIPPPTSRPHDGATWHGGGMFPILVIRTRMLLTFPTSELLLPNLS